MLIIREQQLKAFEAAKKKELPDRIVKVLQEESPSSSATLGQAHLRSLVDTALAAAAQFNLDIDWDLYDPVHIVRRGGHPDNMRHFEDFADVRLLDGEKLVPQLKGEVLVGF